MLRGDKHFYASLAHFVTIVVATVSSIFNTERKFLSQYDSFQNKRKTLFFYVGKLLLCDKSKIDSRRQVSLSSITNCVFKTTTKIKIQKKNVWIHWILWNERCFNCLFVKYRKLCQVLFVCRCTCWNAGWPLKLIAASKKTCFLIRIVLPVWCIL